MVTQKKGAHAWSDVGVLICLRHLFRSRAVTNWIFFRINLFSSTCSTSSWKPSNMCTMPSIDLTTKEGMYRPVILKSTLNKVQTVYRGEAIQTKKTEKHKEYMNDKMKQFRKK